MPTEVSPSEGLVRIHVPLERAPGDAGPEEDWLWAESLGSGRYRVESCPFFAYGISRDDVVTTTGPAETPRLQEVVERGGHRTLRLALDGGTELDAPELAGLLERLLELGCTHEALRPKLVAIDLPPEVDVARVAELLQDGARRGRLVWEWADPRPS
jgi:hypothetical protein